MFNSLLCFKNLKFNLLFLVVAFNSFSQVPTITFLSSNVGEIGQQITINGSGFDPIASNNIVFFGNSQPVIPSSATATTLEVEIPNTDIYNRLYVVSNSKVSNGIEFHLTQFTNGNKTNVWTTSLFKTPTSASIGFSPVKDGLSLSDYDDDGDLDLFLLSSNSALIKIFSNNGTSNVGSYTASQINTTANPTNIKFYDLDNDGKKELIVGLANKNVEIFSYSNSQWIQSNLLTASTSSNEIRVDAADLDNDGFNDIVVFGKDGQTSIQVFKGTSGLNFQNPITLYDGTYLSSVFRFGIADLDADSYPEILFNSSSSGQISYLKNINGSISNSATTLGTVGSGVSYGQIEFLDHDHDGDTDVHVSWQASKIFRNDGDFSFSEINLPNRAHSFLFDLDADGLNDFIQKDLYYDIYISQAQTSSTYSSRSKIIDTANGTTSYLRIGDQNNDSYPDLVYYSGSNLYIAEYQGNLSPTISLNGSISPFSVCENSSSTSQSFTVSVGQILLLTYRLLL
jgi:hypothetical protein